MSNDINNI